MGSNYSTVKFTPRQDREIINLADKIDKYRMQEAEPDSTTIKEMEDIIITIAMDLRLRS